MPQTQPEGKKPRKPGWPAEGAHSSKKARFILRPEVRFKISAPLSPPPDYDETSTYDWRDFLERPDFVTSPVQCFVTAPLHDVWQYMVTGMRLEVPNKDYQMTQNAAVYWVAAVVRFAGYKVLLRYEGLDQDNSYDFWMNLCSKHVHPIGWCAKKSQPLVAPKAVQEFHSDYKTIADWKQFLCKKLTGARTLPWEFEARIVNNVKCPFRAGMHVEMADRSKLSQVRPAIIKEVVGHRLRVRYTEDSELEPAPQTDDDEDEPVNEFWCHMRSPLVHPIGWAYHVGHSIQCTKEYEDECIRKSRGSEDYARNDATAQMFPALPLHHHSTPSTPASTPLHKHAPTTTGGGNTAHQQFQFEKGMKLEAVDPLDLSCIVPATVADVLRDGFLMVAFDGTTDVFCYHRSSPSIFPVGFCESYRIELEQPKGTSANKFSWPEYLKQTKSEMAPVALFNTEKVQHTFKAGQKVECTDLMDPKLVCVATVADVKGRLLHIHFDGWEESFDQWVDCQAPDLFPVGYSEMMGQRLEPPKAESASSPVPKKKSKSSGSTSGNKKSGKH